jgi:outer membrane protein assembly factor BamB
MQTFRSPGVRHAVRRAALLIAAGAGMLAVPTPASALFGQLFLTISAPGAGATVSGTTTVSASVEIVGSVTVRGVQFTVDGVNLGAEDTAPPYSIPWNTLAIGNGSHTLRAVARDLLGLRWESEPVTVTVFNRFEPGHIFVSLEFGPVQWWLPDGTTRGQLPSTVPGLGEGMAFDAAGSLYVARWRDGTGAGGNTVEKFNVFGQSMGAVGNGYNCDPHTIDFDRAGVAYVGQAGCERSVLKFLPGQSNPIELYPDGENIGIFWLDLAADDCTLFYTSVGPNVKRFDVCTGVQLPDFNTTALPGAFTHDLRVLPDGGVLVANDTVITRLDASGAVVRIYEGPVENTLWAGLDLAGDGTFWAANYYSSTVYRFDLDTGLILSSFNTGTPPNTAVAVRVMPLVH